MEQFAMVQNLSDHVVANHSVEEWVEDHSADELALLGSALLVELANYMGARSRLHMTLAARLSEVREALS